MWGSQHRRGLTGTRQKHSEYTRQVTRQPFAVSIPWAFFVREQVIRKHVGRGEGAAVHAPPFQVPNLLPLELAFCRHRLHPLVPLNRPTHINAPSHLQQHYNILHRENLLRVLLL